MNLARFPISGPKLDPTPEDYALEAVLLRAEVMALRRARKPVGSLHDIAARYARVARRLSWAPKALRQMTDAA